MHYWKDWKREMRTRNVTADEVAQVKMLDSKNLSLNEISSVTKRSEATIRNIINGRYDHLLNESETDDETALDVEYILGQTRIFIKEQSEIQNPMLFDIQSDVEHLVGIVSRYENILTEMSKSIEEIKKRMDRFEVIKSEVTPQKPKTPEKPEIKESGFLKWDEVVRRTIGQCDKVSAKVIKRTKADINGDTITIYCDSETKKYLDRHMTLVRTMEKQAQVICGYPIKITW